MNLKKIIVNITNILSEEVSIGGYLFLETDGFLIPADSLKNDYIFNLSIMNNEDKNICSLDCFLYKFDRDDYYGPAKIACHIPSLKVGKYHLYPLERAKNITLKEDLFIKMIPFKIDKSFNVINSGEFYFYSFSVYNLDFSGISSSKTIFFETFEKQINEMTIYLNNTPIKCQGLGKRIDCIISASELPQNNRYESLNVYIKDSNGNKKINHFVHPVGIILKYIEKKTLKIKASKLLTIADPFMITIDTSDNTLGNIVFSKEGFFYLQVKKEDDSDEIKSVPKKLMCGFHKHPGETTKIMCMIEVFLEDGIYTFEEYISDGPIEDDYDSISPIYKVVVPTFKLNGKYFYSLENKREIIFNEFFREKIVLNFKNKNEILNFTLSTEKYKGTIKYYLGNSQVDCYISIDSYITCGVKGTNFEKSDIYYFERLNFLNQRERLYMVPPFEVTVSWDN